MKSRILHYVVIRKSLSVLKLLTSEDQIAEIHSHKVKWSGCDSEIHWECMAEETVGKGGG